MQVYSKTDIGLVRQSNQDACAGGILPENAAWAVVCDGMGGANGGNIASRIAVDIISGQIGALAQENPPEELIRDVMARAVSEANASIHEKAKTDESLRGMGTTVVVAVVAGGAAHVAHAGDSRAYLILPSGAAQQLTMDHSMVQELVNNGDLTEQEAKRHPQKNIITRALGVQSTVELDYCEYPFVPGSRLLICTDGLSNYADAGQIAQLSRESGPADFCEKLISLAKSAGGSDNITVAVIEN